MIGIKKAMPCPSKEGNLKGLYLLLCSLLNQMLFLIGVPPLGHQSTGAGKHPASKFSGPVTQTSALALAPALPFPSLPHHSLPQPHTSLRAQIVLVLQTATSLPHLLYEPRNAALLLFINYS